MEPIYPIMNEQLPNQVEVIWQRPDVKVEDRPIVENLDTDSLVD